jgi:subtilase family serine protease
MLPIRKVSCSLLLLSLVGLLYGMGMAYSQQPDLIISSITYSPPLPHPSDWITFTVVVKNIGNAPSLASTARVTLDGKDETLHDIPALSPGETYQFQRIDKNVAFGKHTCTAYADWNNVVDESNEDNNEKTIIVYVAKKDTYDLIVETLIHTPQNPTNYDTITITAIVRSIAPLTPTTSTLEIKIDGEATPAYYTIPPLAPMETFQVERQVKLDPGIHSVLATADFYDVVDESFEDNNTATDSIDVSPLYIADLVVETLSHSPMNPFTEDMVTLTAVIKNQGNIPATTSTLALIIDSEVTSLTLPVIEPDGIYEIQVVKNFPIAGTYPVTAVADSGGDIPELYEDNNTKEDSITVRWSGPDLVVTSLTHSPMNPTIHDTIVISAVVQNIGDHAVDTTSTLSILVGDETEPQEYEAPSLAPGEMFPVQRMIGFHDPGMYPVTAAADSLDVVAEPYEDNNIAQDVLDVVLPILPDYIVSSITPSEENPDTSETFTITVEVKNIGLADATSTSVLAILAGDELVPSLHIIPALDMGTTFTVQRSLVFTENISYLITGTADVDDQIFEIYEDNNTTTFDIFIGSIFAKLKDYLLGRVDLTAPEKKVADANKDGIIDMADLLYLLIIGRT